MKYGDKFFSGFRGCYKGSSIICKFRYDPVPYTGDRHNSVRPYFRHIKTTQERVWAIAHNKYVRGKRSSNNLPETWDDYRNSDENTRCWKRTKKKRQWM